MPQRWLSADGICTLLSINREMLNQWVKMKYLVRIGSKYSNQARYLDPGPEYAEQLRLGKILHHKGATVPIDLSLTTLLTVAEIAEITGLTLKYVKHMLWQKKTPGYRNGARAVLYSVTTVRDLLWKRNKRKLSKQKSPVLVEDLIRFFWRFQASQDALMPTDEQFEKDDMLARKIQLMLKLPSPQREIAVKEFMAKMDLAKQFTDRVNADYASSSYLPS